MFSQKKISLKICKNSKKNLQNLIKNHLKIVFQKKGFSNAFQPCTKDFDWSAKESSLFLNPSLEEKKKSWIEKISFPDLPRHIWLLSSGTTCFQSLKFVALSKEAFLLSAKQVNEHIKSDSKDRWLNVLPSFHVSGLSIYARAHLSQARIIEGKQTKWCPRMCLEQLHNNKVTLTSLVPTQLRDLLQLDRSPPPSLRVVFVGGDFLSPSLYSQAREKGWNILPTYGMTENASQIATAPLNSLEKDSSPLDSRIFQILPHVKVKILKSHRQICIKSSSLFTGWFFVSEKKAYFKDPKQEGWFQTEDKGSFVNFKKPNGFSKRFEEKNQILTTEKKSLDSVFEQSFSLPSYLKIEGRIKNKIKVGGEFVNLKKLSNLFESLMLEKKFSYAFLILGTPSHRLGSQVDLVVEVSKAQNWGKALEVLKEFQKQVFPYERVKTIYGVEKIKKTPLFKTNSSFVLKQLEF